MELTPAQVQLSWTLDFLPTKIDLRLHRAMNSSVHFLLQNLDNEPVDLSNSSVRFVAYDHIGGTLKIDRTKTSAEHYDPVNGDTTVEFAPEDFDASTDELEWVYELTRIDEDLSSHVHLTGRLIIEPSISGD